MNYKQQIDDLKLRQKIAIELADQVASDIHNGRPSPFDQQKQVKEYYRMFWQYQAQIKAAQPLWRRLFRCPYKGINE